MHKVKQREREREKGLSHSLDISENKREKMQETENKQSKVMKIRSTINNKCRRRKGQEREELPHNIKT